MKFEFKNHTNGFTIIELLIFITINGLLASVTLPRFLSQAQKASQSEAKTFVGTMNRAQQVYYLEHQNVFAPQANFKDLGIGNNTQTKNYTYQIVGGGTGSSIVTNQAILERFVNSPLKAYVGGVSATLQPKTNNVLTHSILCEAVKPAAYGGVMVSALNIVKYSAVGPPSCPVNMIVIK